MNSRNIGADEFPVDGTPVTVDQYVHSTYEGEREFIDGALFERN